MTTRPAASVDLVLGLNPLRVLAWTSANDIGKCQVGRWRIVAMPCWLASGLPRNPVEKWPDGVLQDIGVAFHGPDQSIQLHWAPDGSVEYQWYSFETKPHRAKHRFSNIGAALEFALAVANGQVSPQYPSNDWSGPAAPARRNGARSRPTPGENP